METKPRSFVVNVTVDTHNPVELLVASTGLSSGTIKQAMAKGAVWISRVQRSRSSGDPEAVHQANTDEPAKQLRPTRLRRNKIQLLIGDTLHLYYNVELLAKKPLMPNLVDDQGTYSVWDKPSGMRTQGSKWGDHSALARVIERGDEGGRPVFIVHRLDAMTSGLIVVAHTKLCAKSLAAGFANRQVYKRYKALVTGDFHCSLPLHINQPIDNKSASTTILRAKKTNILLNVAQGNADLGSLEGSDVLTEPWSVLDIEIETGRTHQIRRHLAELGYSVVGDRRYGKAGKLDASDDLFDLQLRSVSLRFTDPKTNSERQYTI